MESKLHPAYLEAINQRDALVAVIWTSIYEHPSSPASEYLYEKMMNLSSVVKPNKTQPPMSDKSEYTIEEKYDNILSAIAAIRDALDELIFMIDETVEEVK
jgi:hypothetical protein